MWTVFSHPEDGGTLFLQSIGTNLLYLLTDWLTSWSTVLPEKLTFPQLVQKFHTFYGPWSVITTSTKASHLSLSWARWIQSVLSHHILITCIVIILPFICSLAPGLSLLQASHQTCISSPPNVPHLILHTVVTLKTVIKTLKLCCRKSIELAQEWTVWPSNMFSAFSFSCRSGWLVHCVMF